jgi:poly(3-hydroxybutyrate) depolymerase
MHYYMYDMSRWTWGAAAPLAAARILANHPLSPFAYTPAGRALAACSEILERPFRRHVPSGPRPFSDGHDANVEARVVAIHPFGRLLHLARRGGTRPPLLVVNPLSGHHSVLLEDFYDGLLAHFDVYVVEWCDARDVPLEAGPFTLDDQIRRIEDDIQRLGPGLHVAAYSQSTVPALAAAALIAAESPEAAPKTLTLIAGPVDVGINPSPFQRFIASHPVDWFERHLITTVPFYYRGASRRVFPGFLQLAAYVSASLDGQFEAHAAFIRDHITRDVAGIRAHRDFYDRFYTVMDQPAELFRDVLQRIFRDPALARGRLRVAGRAVDPGALDRTELLTVEAKADELSAPGQTHAAHDLCTAIPKARRRKLTLDAAGHIDVVRGGRWRREVLPAMASLAS